MKKRFAVILLILILALSGLAHSAEKPLITILATGGTIASVEGKEGLRPAFKPKEMLKLVPELGDYARMHSTLVCNLDSTNMQPRDWIKVAKEIKKAHEGRSRGVVILHGTDTMAYTASALSVMIKNPRFPIVVTGAMKSIDEKHTDARRNLLNAVQYAAYGKPGVYIVFDGKVIKGDRASKTNSTQFDAFSSINYPLVARFAKIRRLGPNVNYPMIRWIAPPKKREGSAVFDFKLDPKVAMVKLTPGFRPEWLEKYADPDTVHGLVIGGFGAGNVPYRAPCNLLPVLEKIIKKGVPVVMVTQCRRGGVNMSTYEVGQKAMRIGVIPGGKLTAEAAVTRLMWILGHTRDMDKVKEFMRE